MNNIRNPSNCQCLALKMKGLRQILRVPWSGKQNKMNKWVGIGQSWNYTIPFGNSQRRSKEQRQNREEEADREHDALTMSLTWDEAMQTAGEKDNWRRWIHGVDNLRWTGQDRTGQDRTGQDRNEYHHRESSWGTHPTAAIANCLLIRYFTSRLRQLSAVWNLGEKYSSPSANAEHPCTCRSRFFGV